MKTINEHIALPTLEEIQLYNEGCLNPERSAELKELARDNGFIADALEGFAAIPAFSSVPKAGKIFVSSGGTPWWHLAGWASGIAIGAALAVLFISRQTHIAPVAETENAANTFLEKENIQPAVTEKEENKLSTAEKPVAELKINPQEPGQVEKLSVENKTGNDATGEIYSASTVPFDNLAPDSGFSYITIKDYWMNDMTMIEGRNGLHAPTSNIPDDILHIRNYHIVDYTATRKSEWPSLSIENIGVPARFENSAEKERIKSEEIVRSVPYMDYIDHCIQAFSRGNYKTSIANFNVVLKQYPDDINALFYGAMSYYEDGQYQMAMDRFTEASTSAYRTFDEEIAFYKAKSLKGLKRFEEADQQFRLIAGAGGFYAVTAWEEILSKE